MSAVLYHGSKDERARLRADHWLRADRGRGGGGEKKHMPVMITSYEIVIRDCKELRRIPWNFIVIDEGHRLKNMHCRLIRAIRTLCVAGTNRLLLTGTPLQNNLTELWSLLHFLLPGIFDNLESFQAWFDFDLSREDAKEQVMRDELQRGVVTKLHQILRPFLLRRLKQDVELEIPTKWEYVLFASLTQYQRSVYSAILAKNLKDSAGKDVRLNNMLMQLRKCCNHPFLLEWPVDGTGSAAVDEGLVLASGKMQLLDRLMTRLRQQGGHRVLIFSQMTRMLDIVEDYMALRAYSFRRLDGSVPATERIRAMEDFQGDASIDAFLLSTRAGGLGVNLTAADTCIIFDSDWNPHMDLQAQDRCHRIGQTKRVVVYRLATVATVEEKVLKAANDKLKLEQLVVSKGKVDDPHRTRARPPPLVHTYRTPNTAPHLSHSHCAARDTAVQGRWHQNRLRRSGAGGGAPGSARF